MKKLVGTFLLIGMCATGAALAQKDPAGAKAAPAQGVSAVDEARYMTALSDARRKLFADSMSGLTAPQLEIFWGVYADYEKEKNALAAARVDLVRKFVESFGSASGLGDADVTEAVRQMASLQKQQIDLRVKYFDIYSSKLDAKAAGRFALTDDYVQTSVRLDWLNRIPFPGDEKR